MLNYLKIFLVISTSAPAIVKAASTYDQSQTGELNVQVDLKDVKIITLMKSSKEEYVDYDYAYDYSEMTIKPQNGITPKPLNVSSTATEFVKDNTTTAAGTTVSVDTTTPDYIRNSTLSTLDSKVTEESSIETTTPTKTAPTTTKAPEVPDSSMAPITASPVANLTNCKKGFVLNQKGGCEFKLQSASNALLKIIKLSQKLKRRENRQETADE